MPVACEYPSLLDAKAGRGAMTTVTASTQATPRRRWYTVLYIQVLLAILVGILIGHFFPNAGVVRLRHKLPKASDDAAFEGWKGGRFCWNSVHKLGFRLVCDSVVLERLSWTPTPPARPFRPTNSTSSAARSGNSPTRSATPIRSIAIRPMRG